MFLRPSAETNQLFLYVLAVAAERFGIVVHAYCVLSNHFHCVLSDPDGVLPAFEQYLASLVARSVNALHGHWESFWAPGSYSAVSLSTPEDVLEKMAYVLANPVSAGLVRRGSEWPGLWSSPDMIGGRPITVERPAHFFRAVGPLPATASLSIAPPPGVECVGSFRRSLAKEVSLREERAARELEAERRSFLGAPRVLAQKPLSWPTSREPRLRLNPRVAGRDKWKRIEAIARLKEFLKAYRSAWLEFASGVRDVVFPHGTYWMHIAYGLPCAAAG